MNAPARERPIIFSGPMVSAILDGSKTQTRRAVKPQPALDKREWRYEKSGFPASYIYWWLDGAPANDKLARECYPYGQIGDQLWVRETWAAAHQFDHLKPSEITQTKPIRYMASWEGPCGLLKRPSIFMPRWASRITLEVVNVRVERLQEINQEDCIAEGVTHYSCGHPDCSGPAGETGMHYGPRGAYYELWDKINGRGAWDKNPWVWVVEFKKVRP